MEHESPKAASMGECLRRDCAFGGELTVRGPTDEIVENDAIEAPKFLSDHKKKSVADTDEVSLI